MSRHLLARARKLDASRPDSFAVHVLCEHPDKSTEQLEAERIAAGEAKPGDKFIVLRFVAPGPNGPERVFHPDPDGFMGRARQ